MKITYSNRGQTLVGWLIVLLVVGLVSGGFYAYLQYQSPDVSDVSEEITEEKEVTTSDEASAEATTSQKRESEEENSEQVTAPKEKTPVEKETCQDQCSLDGQRRCSDSNHYKVCGNYDSDSCLEWSSSQTCGTEEICSEGQCETEYSAHSYKKCYNNALYWYDSQDQRREKIEDCGSDSCQDWGADFCEDNKVYHQRTCYDRGCSNGSCFSNSYSEKEELNNCKPSGKLCSDGVCKDIDSPCQNEFKMAFILVAKDESELTSERLAKLKKIKSYFSDDFYRATQYLGHMDTSYEISTMVDDGSLIPEENHVYTAAVTRRFYDNNPDNFDFISLYTTFDPLSHTSHLFVRNQKKGVAKTMGKYDREVVDNSDHYGSDGNLLGINFMGNIDSNTINPVTEGRSYSLIHETGHQWCCYVGENSDLPILGSRNFHWSSFLRLNNLSTEETSVMGGAAWVEKEKDTFVSKTPKKIPTYHNLTLYFMGLLPKSVVPGIELVEPEDQEPPYESWTEPLRASVKTITIEDILSEGQEVECGD